MDKALGLLKKVLFLTFLLSGMSTQAFADHLESNLRAVTLQYPPYEYLKEGEAKGLAVEVLQEAVKRTNEKGVDIHFFPWKRSVREIEFGEAQVLFNAGKNEARQKWGRYSKHVLILQKYYLFQRADDPFESNPELDNLSDRRIAIRRGYLYGTGALKRAIVAQEFQEIYETDSSSSSIKLLLSDRVNMFVGDLLPVMHYIKENGLQDKIKLVRNMDNDENLVVLTWPTYFLFSKRNISEEYVRHFDRVFQDMINDGTYDAIVNRYLPKVN